jgi:hypothetical protein
VSTSDVIDRTLGKNLPRDWWPWPPIPRQVFS